MKYINKKTKEVVSYSEIVKLNKNTSFPKIGAKLLGECWELVSDLEKPTFDNELEKLEVGGIEETRTGFIQKYNIVKLEVDVINIKKSNKVKSELLKLKSETSFKILSLVNEVDQRNLLFELNFLLIKKIDKELSEEDKLRISEINEIFNKIKSFISDGKLLKEDLLKTRLS